MSLIKELKRRNVIRVAIAYVVVTWLSIEVSATTFPLLNLPEWAATFVMVLLIIGFPVALIFAWAFEMTPEGLKREHEVDRSQSITSQTGRRLDFLIIGVLVVAVGMLLVDKFLLSEPPMVPEPYAEDISEPEDSVPSIAVLPFVNMSADEDNAYFSDGLADTILHMLAQIPGLHVAARTSSFQFRGQSPDVAKIREQLNVGTFLEGSVQRSGDKIRVTAQLIDVSNGYHLWSGNFDRELQDVFAIQDEIATAVVSALKVSLLGESVGTLGRDQTDNIDAYTEYLLGIDDLNVESTKSLASAIGHFQEAIRIDPDYALAHAMLGRAYIANTSFGSLSRIEGHAAARAAANHALDISLTSSSALTVLGLAELRDGDLDTAGEILSKAIEYGPNNTIALGGYAEYLFLDRRPAESTTTYRKILSLDPLSNDAYWGFADLLMKQMRYSEASELIARWKSNIPMSTGRLWSESMLEWEQGNFAAVVVSMTEYYRLDSKDPEGPFMIGFAYLEMDMPTEANQWFDRVIEINAQHPVSQAAPIVLNFYLERNDYENVLLAREILTDRIDDRWDIRDHALRVLVEYAAKTGRHDVPLESLENLYPNLFDDPPHNLDSDYTRTYYTGIYYAGIALFQSGEVERGQRLMRFMLEQPDPRYGAGRVRLRSVVAHLILGDTDGALDKLEGHSRSKHNGYLDLFDLENNSIYDPIRNEPVFIEVIEEYRVNAAEQRQILQKMNADTSGQ